MNYDDEDGFRRSAGFQTCCIAGFPIGSRKTRNGPPICPAVRDAIQQIRKPALRFCAAHGCEL